MQLHLEAKIYDSEEIGKARALVEGSVWPEAIKELLLQGLAHVATFSQALREKSIANDILRNQAFGPSSEKTATLFDEVFAETTSEPAPLSENEQPNPWRRGRRRPRPRLHVVQKVDSRRITAPHEAGAACPNCTSGRLHPDKPRREKLVMATSLVTLTVVELEALRCRACEHTEVAAAPMEFAKSHLGFHHTAIALFADLRYRLGMPSLRIEGLTASQGIPVSDSTQFRLFEWAAGQMFPVFRAMKTLAAEARLTFRDDTPNRVHRLRHELRRRKKNGDERLRVGITTTGVEAHLEDGHRLALFFTGTTHAGEMLHGLLERRTVETPMLAMSDALAANLKHGFAERVETLLCLVHARRNFVELRSHYPDEVRRVLGLMKVVFHADEHCRQKLFSAEERLAYHQAHSAPALEELRSLTHARLCETEENSYIHKAYLYLLKHWEGLTGFLRIAGAPIENNAIERDLKVAIRHRKNSLGFLTENGALVADVLTSLLHTAHINGVNPQAYLATLLDRNDEVRVNAEAWMPWSVALRAA